MDFYFPTIRAQYEKVFTDDLVTWIGQTKAKEIRILMAQGLTREEAWKIVNDFKITI